MQHLSAQRIISGEIFYEQIDSFKYIVTAHLYRKCEGSSLSKINGFIYTDSLKINMNFKRVSIINISDTCGNPCNILNDLSNPGIEKHTYVDSINLKSSSYKIILQKNICNIYFGINQPFREGNLNTLEDNWFYLDAMVNICHSGKFLKSPAFNIQPKYFLNCNYSTTYSPGVLQFNHEDSLGFELMPIEYDKNKYISYKSGFSLQFPLTPYCPPNPGVNNCRALPNAKPARGFFFNDKVCEVTYTPTFCNEKSIIKFRINQYRYNSITKQQDLIGYVQREMVQEVTIKNNYEPSFNINNQYNVCADRKLCLNIKTTTDQNKSDTFKIDWNYPNFDADVRLLDSTLREKELEICFSPKNKNNRIKNYFFSVVSNSNQCNSFSSKGFVVTVKPNSFSSEIEINPILGCNKLSFNLKPINYDSSWKTNLFKYQTKIKHLQSQKYLFNSTNKFDTFKYRQSGYFVIESSIDYSTTNCGSIKYDTIYLESISALLDEKNDSLVCFNDTIILGNSNYNQNSSKVSWEFPIGNTILDSSNTLLFVQNGDKNKIRMRYQNNICNDYQDVEIYSNGSPISTTYHDTSICINKIIQLSINQSELKPPFTTLWIINNKDSVFVYNYGNLTIDSSKQVKVQLIKNPKCYDEKNFTIHASPLPKFSFTDSIICLQNTTNISPLYNNHLIPIKSYRWFINNNSINTNDSTIDYVFSEPNSILNLIITDSLACSYNQVIEFKTIQPPKIQLIENTSCEKSDYFIQVFDTSSTQVNYLWTIDQDIQNNQTNKLTSDFRDNQDVKVKVTDSFGCYSEKSVLTNLKSKPEFDIIAPPFCKNQSVFIDLNIRSISPINNYNWFINGNSISDNSKIISIKINDISIIKCQLKDNNNCLEEKELIIQPNQADIQITGNLNYNYHDKVVLSTNNDFNSYLWSNYIKTRNVDFWAKTLGPPGNYPVFVTVSDSLGCRFSDTVIISTNQFTNLQLASNADIKIYPNPFQEILVMETSESGNIEIYNIKGQLLHTQSIEIGKNILLMQNWGKGVYLLKFKNKTYKLVIG